MMLVDPKATHTKVKEALVVLCFAMTWFGPVMAIAVVGRDRLFNVMARRLERDPSRRQQDGAFVAALLESFDVAVDQSW